jgi:putative endonuclease
MAKHNDTGKIGEQLATEYLQTKDYMIIERNWRYNRAEIDIIAKKGRSIIFVEVKTRSSLAFGTPASFVSARKERFMMQAASVYAHETNHDWEIRFDIIAILLKKNHAPEITHFEDAFFSAWE